MHYGISKAFFYKEYSIVQGPVKEWAAWSRIGYASKTGLCQSKPPAGQAGCSAGTGDWKMLGGQEGGILGQEKCSVGSPVGRHVVRCGTRTWHLFQILSHSRAVLGVEICATCWGHMDLSSPCWDCSSSPQGKGSYFPFPWPTHIQPKICAGYSKGMHACLFQH